MAGQRNRIIELADYISSFGIDVNIAKNKARGNKGVFIRTNKSFRIDLNKSIKDEESSIKILLHEFAHYVHSVHDKSLKSLDFAFGKLDNNILEELIQITVQEVPKDSAKMLFDKKEEINSQIKEISAKIKNIYPDFKISSDYKTLEKNLPLYAKYFLKYDRIRVFNNLYSVECMDEQFPELNEEQKNYIKLKSKQRSLRKINSKITKLNSYYNQPTELFARFVELYYTNPLITKKIAPISCKKFEETLLSKKIPELTNIENHL